MERVHVSGHIEKNAGTTVQAAYEKLYGPENVLVYHPTKDGFVRADKGLSRTNACLHKLRTALKESPILPIAYRLYAAIQNKLKPENQVIKREDLHYVDFSVLHGHFVVDRFSPMFEEPLLTIVFRDPLERMVSQYSHWRRNEGDTKWRHNVPFDPELTFKDFAFMDEHRNYQAQAMGDLKLEDFHLIGVTDHLGCFIQDLGLRNYQPRQLNKSPIKPSRQKLGIDKETISQFKKFHALDYEFYEKAHRLVQ